MASATGESTVQITDGTTLFSWSFGSVALDEGRWQLNVGGEVIELERKPLEVLQYLLRHAGEAVTKEELLSTVWEGRVVVEAVLTNAVGKLRKALRDEEQRIILTLPKVGYRLDAKVSRRAVDHVPEASRLSVGDTVPRRSNWRLEEALARGGNGEVWLARHSKTGQNRVFKFSLDGQRLVGLKREVTVGRLLEQALGPRPDLVRVIDWDFEQAPFFIEFEYGGISLDRWMESGGTAVPLETRLAMFIQAANAVAAAHGVGVLHKDLKPANLLVYGTSDDWRLRVADFGSSRVFEVGLLESLGITRLGFTQTQALSPETGTPLYMPPEVLAGQSPTTKSDVYALGLTLYQLIVGDFRRPLSAGWENDIADPLLRDDIADAANGDPDKRLDSAAQLAERIRTLGHRRQKAALEAAVKDRIAVAERRAALARARRPWIAAAMVVLMAGTAVSLFYAHRSREETKKALAAQSYAEEQAKRAQAAVSDQTLVNDFLITNFVAVDDPFNAAKGTTKDLSVHQAWLKAEAKIPQQFAQHPDLEFKIRLKLCPAYGGRSQWMAAKEQCVKALTLADTHPKDIAENDEWQARLYLANVLINLGEVQEFDRDMTPLRKASEDGRLDKYPFQEADYYFTLAKRYRDSPSIVIPMLQKSYALAETLGKTRPTLVVTTGVLLGQTLSDNGKNDEALQVLDPLRDKANALLGPKHPLTLMARQVAVYPLINLHRYAEAQHELDALTPEMGQTLGKSSGYYGAVIGAQAQLWVTQGLYTKALPLMADLYQLDIAIYGEHSLSTLTTEWQYADVARFDDSKLASKLLDQLDATIKTLPADTASPLTMDSKMVRLCVLVSQGQSDKARAFAVSLTEGLKKLDWERFMERANNIQKTNLDQQHACSSTIW